jgi:hypothetical protein
MEADKSDLINFQFGPGSVAAVMSLIGGWEHMWATLDPSKDVIIIADMSQAKTASLRVQYLIGKWLLQHKIRIRRIAICGAGTIQVAIVQSVMTLARIKRVRFFTNKDKALRWATE